MHYHPCYEEHKGNYIILPNWNSISFNFAICYFLGFKLESFNLYDFVSDRLSFLGKAQHVLKLNACEYPFHSICHNMCYILICIIHYGCMNYVLQHDNYNWSIIADVRLNTCCDLSYISYTSNNASIIIIHSDKVAFYGIRFMSSQKFIFEMDFIPFLSR